MFGRISERTIQVIRWALVIGWLAIIASLLSDPLSSRFTAPGAAASPFRLNRLSTAALNSDRYRCPVADEHGGVDWSPFPAGTCDPRCARVQGRCLIQTAYPMGARVFWTMILPLVPFFLLVFGHEAWRRLCPLSALMQLPRILGVQRRERIVDPRTGRVETKVRLVKAGSFLARNFWFVQFGLLWLGLSFRLLFINSDRVSLAIFFLAVIAIAIAVGYLFGGKTWCQYLCPLSPVQKFYTEPRGLFESTAHHAPAGGPALGVLTQSSCRRVDAQGKEQSTCVGCRTPCPDIDLERQYWKDLQTHGRRFFYYGYLGLVLGFYVYYRLYAGNWEYYFTGAWTHDESQLGSLLAPGWYLFGHLVPIPKVVAAPVTLAAFIATAYLFGRLVERGYRWWRERQGRPLHPLELRHRVFSVFTFLTFNSFYAFAGRPNIALLPASARTVVDALLVAVSTAWLVTRFRRNVEEYEREGIAASLRRQLVQLRLDTPKLFDGRSLEHLRTDEVYALGRVLPELTAGHSRTVYRETLRDALSSGHTSSAAARNVLRVVRQQLNINDTEHTAVLGELGLDDGDALDPESASLQERRLRIGGYRAEMEAMLASHLEAGTALGDALREPAIQARVATLQLRYAIDDKEHQEVCESLLGSDGALIRRVRDLTRELIQLGRVRGALGRLQGERAQLAKLLILEADRRHEKVATRVAAQLAALGDSDESFTFAHALAQSRAAATAVLASAAQLHPDLAAVIEKGAATAAAAAGDLRPSEALAEIAASWDPAARRIADTLSRGTAALAAGPEDGPDDEPAGLDPALARRMGQMAVSPLFQHLPLESIERLCQLATATHYAPGQLISGQGAPSEDVLLVVEGSAKVLVETARGTASVGVVEPGQTIGELGAITGEPRSAAAVADDDGAAVLSIPTAIFRALLDQDLRAATGMLRLVSERLTQSIGKVAATGAAATGGRADAKPN
jgi:hypothetical protein